MLKTYKKGSREKISDHFRISEFACKCNKCSNTLLDDEILPKLEKIRSLLGSAISITSGYRCKDYQLELRLRGYETATGTSTHEQGRAADILCEGKTGKEIAEAAEKAGFLAIGIGHSFCHVDLRADRPRRWNYTQR